MEKFRKIQMRPINVSECRSCLMTSQNLIPLTSSIEATADHSFVIIHEMLQAIYPSKVASLAHVTGICVMCLSQLKIAYEFKLRLKETEKTLSQRLETSESGTTFQDNEMTTEEPAQEPSTVELICGRNKYDLRNVVIVEDEVVEEHNYAGFLDNLGTEISAEFVKDKAEDKTERTEETAEQEISIFVNIPDHNYSAAEKPAVASGSEKAKSYQCNLCDFVTTNRSNYNFHVLKHGGRKFQCDMCPKSFYRSSKLNNHIKMFHNGYRPFLCSLCGKGFCHHSALLYHMKVHNNERNYPCKVCGYKFYVAGNLSRHMLTHTKEKPFRCRFCDKNFSEERHRKLHENMHLNIKPYTCKYCGKQYYRRSNLEYHHMTHAGTFKCTVCPKSFVEAKFLTSHLTKTHKFVKQ